MKALVVELFPEALVFYGDALFNTRCLIVQDLYHAIMRLINQFSPKNPDCPMASGDAHHILNRCQVTWDDQELRGRTFDLSAFWADPAEAARRVGIIDFPSTGKLSQLNVGDDEVKEERQKVFDTRNEENLLWGSPTYVLPPSVLKGLADAFSIIACPFDALGWKSGQSNKLPAFADYSTVDAALRGLEYCYSVQHSSQATDMAMAGDIMRRSFAHKSALDAEERAEWLQLAREYKDKGVDSAFMQLDLETLEGQEKGITTAIIAEARYDLLAFELQEPLSRHGVCTGPQPSTLITP